MRQYQICTNCVMDTTDSKITFDNKGVCTNLLSAFLISFSKDIF